MTQSYAKSASHTPKKEEPGRKIEEVGESVRPRTSKHDKSLHSGSSKAKDDEG